MRDVHEVRGARPSCSARSRSSEAGWWRRSAVTYASTPEPRTASNKESPEPPTTATRSTRPSGSPANRIPCSVKGRASATTAANARKVVGSASRPTRPIPVDPGQVASSRTSNAGSS